MADEELSEDRSPAQPALEAPASVVIAVGATVGSLQSLEVLLSGLLPDPSRALVVVLQHAGALPPERLTAVASPHPVEWVKPARDPIAVNGGRVYVTGPDAVVTFADGQLHARPSAHDGNGEGFGDLDGFLVSLAHDRGPAAVAVLLNGTGSTGTLGVVTLKERGGLTIAEWDGAGDAHATGSAAASALADVLLPVEDIPPRIRTHLAWVHGLQQDGRDVDTASFVPALRSIATLLRNRTGHDFHGYKQGTFVRRIQRRMQVVQARTVDDYVQHLRNDADEVQNLFNDLLIGVTQFFRDNAEFAVIENQVVPQLFQGRGAKDHIRVWVLGCATGEEAYSLAILLREHMSTLPELPHVQIFATDIDARALAAARTGRYSSAIAGHVSPERLTRWFVKEGNTWCVTKELREMCIFSALNVIRDAPFSRLDLISCRNLLIYLNAELQNQVIPLFHFALRPGGFLFLGNAENVTRHPRLFAPLDRRSRVFRRLEASGRTLPNFPLHPVSGPRTPDVNAQRRELDGQLARRAERIAERYAPAYIVIDERFEALHFSPRTGRYLDPAGGAATLDVLSLVHRDLRLDLRSALQRAADEDKPVRLERLELGQNGSRMAVDLLVEPTREPEDGRRHFVIVFKDGPVMPLPDGPDEEAGRSQSEHIQRLEQELRITRDRLQATIEELETTNEELKSSNEEYQSLNEELQSANEELETSKEELQSVNEELTTVNGELAHRVQELTRASSEDVRKVMRTLGSTERTIENPATRTRYIARVLPYRSVDNFIAGAVLTFVDVTAIARAEERHKFLLAELQHRVRNTLGVVRSIARRTAENSSTVGDFAQHLDGRLSAFARVQAAVTRDPAGGVDLATLVSEELLAHAAHEGERVTVGGPSLRLQAKAAESLALAIHELATNAVKYGALAGPGGRILIRWDVQHGGGDVPVLTFSWIESGLPPSERRMQRRGFGMELLERSLHYELRADADVTLDESGLCCRLRIPLSERVLAGELPL